MNDMETLKKGKIVGIVFGIILAVASLITILVGIIFVNLSDGISESEAVKKETFIPAEATIVNMVRVKDSIGGAYTDHDWHVYIEFDVDGRTYSTELNHYNSDMYNGQKVNILYNPDNPEDIIYEKNSEIVTSSFKVIGIGIAIFGILTLVLGIVIAVKCTKSYKELKESM